MRCPELKRNQLTVAQPRWKFVEVVKDIQHCVWKGKDRKLSPDSFQILIKSTPDTLWLITLGKKRPIVRFMSDAVKLTLAAVAHEAKYYMSK